MKLIYHKGKNFGDALNPFIFNQILPNFFDNSEKELFLGIGSIIGLKQDLPQKKIVFSSGYAAGDVKTYGRIPVIDKSWDFCCVRGPLTANILGLDKALAVADGAILLYKYYNRHNKKKFRFSYMPHHISFNMYSKWKELLSRADVNLIDPRLDIHKVLENIDASEFLITEAMHGAIAADALRVPWKGVSSYPYINKFKWDDWAASLNMETNLMVLPSIHDFDFFRKVIKNKSKSLIPEPVLGLSTKLISNNRERQFTTAITKIKHMDFQLSDEKLINSRCNQLIDLALNIKKKYT